MHEMDIVPDGVLPHKDRMVRTEVVQHDDQEFVWLYLFLLVQDLPDIFLFGVVSKRDDGIAVDGKNAKGICLDLFCNFYERCVIKRPHPSRIGRGLWRGFIKDSESRLFAHPREFLGITLTYWQVRGNPVDRVSHNACQTISGYAGSDRCRQRRIGTESGVESR